MGFNHLFPNCKFLCSLFSWEGKKLWLETSESCSECRVGRMETQQRRSGLQGGWGWCLPAWPGAGLHTRPNLWSWHWPRDHGGHGGHTGGRGGEGGLGPAPTAVVLVPHCKLPATTCLVNIFRLSVCVYIYCFPAFKGNFWLLWVHSTLIFAFSDSFITRVIMRVMTRCWIFVGIDILWCCGPLG